MMSAPRPRFSVRAGLTEAPEHDGPFENVPEHLQQPLQEWVGYALDTDDLGDHTDEEAVERTLCLRLRISPSKQGRFSTYHAALTTAVGPRLLDVIDAVLAYKAECGAEDPDAIRRLTAILDDAGSAYCVAESGDGLEERVSPAVRDAVRRTIADAAAEQSAGSAADHLTTAWQAAYGRSPNAVRAYSEAIKAVESAAHAVVQPNNAKATLGTMLGEINNARHKFATALSTPARNDPVAPSRP